MQTSSLKDSFINYCKTNSFEENLNQLKIINLFTDFLNPKKNLFDFFSKKNHKLCFYLFGGVGIGKTMISNFVFDYLKIPKKRIHFNEFMISFHDYRHSNKNNTIKHFVNNLKKYDLLYLDEFQVTNIVDAMILGKLFETIFKEGVKVIITSNIKIENLYKDGLQREQFLPFIKIIKKYSIQSELSLEDDYRKIGPNKLQRAFYPINEKNIFKFNQFFRTITKNKNREQIKLNIKGRDFLITNFFEGIAKFDFKELCDENIGAEDYLELANKCKFIGIENIPKFNNENSNQQNRFITLIDILYDKKIPIMISISSNINNLESSAKLKEAFKRTSSRLFELTSPDINI
tara:strand:- start:632 stop:1672 length:1041 start_codon:yes stop_codon:yes gene_type:complete